MSSLENVTNSAVWGSLIGSVALGAFMTVQAVLDPPRRRGFAWFALFTLSTVVTDFSRPWMSANTYEMLRIATWSFYGASVVLLHGLPGRLVALSALVPSLLGAVVWVLQSHDLAMTFTLPTSLAIAAVTHMHAYRKRHGYASAVLAAHTTAMTLSCSIYYLAISSGDQRVIVIGYAHWAYLNVLAVLFGWIHLPRELRGLAPVQLGRSPAVWAFVAVMLSELAVIAGMLVAFSWPPELYLMGNLGLTVATALTYFHQRHRLVIYTDNVSALLEERTADLRTAQAELARQNEVQADRLREQERELKARAEVIARQRRLELAAQTAGQAAHDIQNILSPILTSLGDLSRASDAGPDAAQAASLIRRRVEDLLELNGQLLALSRRGRMERNPVRLTELSAELSMRYPGQPLMVGGAGDPWIEGSWSQLSRAVQNLVSNALEAAGSGGAVRLETGEVEVLQTRRCHLGYLKPGRYATLSVTDDGPGIAPAHLEQIFEPFFSLKKSGERSGSGLGLSIVAAVVDDHAGVLDLETRSGRTAFTLYFPVIEAPGVDTGDDLLCGNATVVVTEDHTPMLDWYARILEEAGYTVLKAASGQEAIHHLQAGPVDAMVLDLKMPQMTGYETFFGAMHLCPGIRAVVHSSYVSQEDSVRLRALGIDEFLQKPASRRDMLLALRRVLSSRESAAA